MPVVLVQHGPLGVFDVHHQLHGFGDVPSGFEHVHQPHHARRSAQRHVELAALPVIGPGVVELQRLFEVAMDLT